MKVILQQNIAKLGKVGDVVNVKPGFARNFLLPQGKVMLATAANLAVFETRRGMLEKAAEQELVGAKARGEQLEKLVLSIEALASDEGKLFGSIGPREIVDAVMAAGETITKQEVIMPEGPIRMTGEHQITLMPHSDVSINVQLTVTAKAGS